MITPLSHRLRSVLRIQLGALVAILLCTALERLIREPVRSWLQGTVVALCFSYWSWIVWWDVYHAVDRLMQRWPGGNN